MKKKILLYTLVFILFLLISAFTLGPFAARKYVNSHGRELIGRTVSLEKIRINPFSFTVMLTGFKMLEKDDAAVFTGFDSLIVDLQPFRLLRSELAVKKFRLVNPVARIIKRDSIFNFSDIRAFLAASDTTATEDSENHKTQADTGKNTRSDFKFELSDIRLINGDISYTDEIAGHTTRLGNLGFTIPYISWNQEEASKAGLSFNFRNGGYFSADGSYDTESGEFISSINIGRLDLNEFSPYLKPYIFINSVNGLAGCSLDIRGNTNNPDALMVSGNLSVDSLAVKDNTDRKILGGDEILLTLGRTQPLAGKFYIDSLVLKSPYILFELADSSNNFIELLQPVQSDTLVSENTEAETISDPLFYSVNSFRIKNGVIDFQDLNLADPFRYNLSQISLAVDSITSASTWLTAYSGMKLNKQGDLRTEIGINPSDPYELKVDYTLTNFQLPDISPYSRFYLGSAIIEGNMFYTGKTSITARQISSENKLVIKDAEIGRKAGGIFNVPLRLALYLIKDLNGDIIIDLPVSGNLNDPSVRIGRLVWATFKNLIVKIAASPFIALSGIFGIDQKDLQQIDFNYADTILTESNTRKLDQLLTIKDKKPELNIELVYYNDRIRERELVAAEEAGKIFRSQTGGDHLNQPAEFEAFLKKTLLKDTINLYPDCIALAGAEKTGAITSNREKLRIRMVEEYLAARDSLSRIKILVPNPDAIRNAGSKPVFEVKFSVDE